MQGEKKVVSPTQHLAKSEGGDQRHRLLSEGKRGRDFLLETVGMCTGKSVRCRSHIMEKNGLIGYLQRWFCDFN